MQKSNNHSMNELTMITIPTEMLEEAGIDEFDGIEVFVDRGRIIIQRLEDEDDCDCCPYCGCREDHRL